MKKIFLFTSLILISYHGFSQTCDCSSNLEWLIKTFEKNDAGFQYVIDKKGEKSYLTHNSLYTEKASKISNLTECHKLLNDWTEYFRKFHLYVKLIHPKKIKKNKTVKRLTNNEIIEKYKNAEKFEITIKEREIYLQNLKINEGFEGVWTSDQYSICIMKDKTNLNREYVGFVINSKSPYWQDNQIKMEISKYDKTDSYRVKYYMRDHSVRQFDRIEFIGKNYLLIKGFALFKRKLPKLKTEPYINLYFKTINSKKPIFETISDNTVYLRIPSFTQKNKYLIDSVLKVNNDIILNSQNLIIDLRSNGGGADRSYENIIQYIYTNPIRKIGVQYLSTTLNNKRMFDFSKNEEFDKEFRDWAKNSLIKLDNNLNHFINLEDTIIETQRLDTIYKNPKNVAILVNKNCGSTTEQFILEAKQSKKVKIYGTTTLGSLDISNQNSVNSPCNEFKLWYGISKSYRIPKFTIDDIGIQPDYFLDKSIPDWEWVKYTSEIMDK